MSKHTPGEWIVHKRKGHDHTLVYCSIKAKDEAVAFAGVYELRHKDRKLRESECIANARLIAAAPELLAACIAVDQYLTDINEGAAVSEQLETTIRKARGE